MKTGASSQASDFQEITSLSAEIGTGHPSFGSLTLSVSVHAVLVVLIGLASIQRAFVARQTNLVYEPTEVRIGGKLYYVAPIRSSLATQPATGAAPRRGSGPQVPPDREPAPPTVAESRTRELRPFVRPPLKADSLSAQTLIQLESPPELRPQNVKLPSFRIWLPQLPVVRKPFVAPGHRASPIVRLQPLAAPPTLPLVSAIPAPSVLTPKLTLPAAPLIAAPPVQTSDAPAKLPSGDPAAVLSISDFRAVPIDRLVIPPGNVVGETTQGPKGLDSGASPGGSSGTSREAASISGAGKSSKSLAGEAVGSGSGRADGSGPGLAGTSTGPDSSGSDKTVASGTSGSGPAEGVLGPNRGGGSGPVGDVAVAGSGTTQTVRPRAVLVRPSGGSFDAQVTHSSLDFLPDGQDLLTGRPIYTVYIPVGAPKEWALYFCVPRRTSVPDPAEETRVLHIEPVALVKPPYPTRLVVPEVTLPSYEKYLLVHGYITEKGVFQNLRVVAPHLPGQDEAVIGSFAGWELRAATRDGVPITVEFLLAIPAAGLLPE